MKIKKRFVFCLAVFFLASCSPSPSSPPLIQLNVNGDTITGLQGAYCWDSGITGTLCVDPFPPSFEGQTPLEVPGPIRLVLDQPLPQTLNLSLTTELFGDDVTATSLEVSNRVEWSPNVPAGAYILNVHGAWKQGDVTYWFYISLP